MDKPFARLRTVSGGLIVTKGMEIHSRVLPVEGVIVSRQNLLNDGDPVIIGAPHDRYFRVTGFTRTSTRPFCCPVNANPDQHTDLHPIPVPEAPRHRAMLMGLLINEPPS